jgi:hypothetical protein
MPISSKQPTPGLGEGLREPLHASDLTPTEKRALAEVAAIAAALLRTGELPVSTAQPEITTIAEPAIPEQDSGTNNPLQARVIGIPRPRLSKKDIADRLAATKQPTSPPVEAASLDAPLSAE